MVVPQIVDYTYLCHCGCTLFKGHCGSKHGMDWKSYCAWIILITWSSHWAGWIWKPLVVNT